MELNAKLYQDLDRILITREEITQAVRTLGERITRDYEGKELVLLGILKGAIVFFSDIMREIDLPVTTEFMAVSSYGSATKTSGVTLNYLKKHLQGRGAASIRIATLLDKPAGRRVDLKADYVCFEIPDAFVVGYGLDYDEKYRNLPDIGVLSPSVYA